jgi:hypothetical protein
MNTYIHDSMDSFAFHRGSHLLIEALKHAVVPFVELPRCVLGDLHGVDRGQNVPQRADGAPSYKEIQSKHMNYS